MQEMFGVDVTSGTSEPTYPLVAWNKTGTETHIISAVLQKELLGTPEVENTMPRSRYVMSLKVQWRVHVQHEKSDRNSTKYVQTR